MTIKTTAPRRTRLYLSLALNLCIVVLELIGLAQSWAAHGTGLFQFYTEDSNLFGLFACALCAGAELRCLARGEAAPPLWVKLIKYMAVCCLTVTFVVVLCVLAPAAGMGGYGVMLFRGSMLYHHTLCPVLALLSFCVGEGQPPLRRRHSLWALLPTVVYALVSVALNIARVWEGPYPFLLVYRQPVWMSVLWGVLIVGGAYLLALLVRLLNRKCAG